MSLKKLSELSKIILKHPLGRGMLTYSITFPTACLIQEYADKKKLHDVNWRKCVRFSIYGIFISAPLFYGWIRITQILWKKQNLSTSIQKSLIEQVTYGPLSISLFFFCMSYCESYNFDKAVNVINDKFWDTFKVQMCYWPIIQTINFNFIPNRNRVVFVGFASFIWTLFLTYVNQHGSPLKPEIEKSKSVESRK